MVKINSLKIKKKHDVDMTEGSIFMHLISFAIPLLVGNLFQMLYNTVDTWVVGNFVSDAAFSAVGTLGSVTTLMIGFFTGFASGAGVVISQYFGSKSFDKVKTAVHTAAAVTLILCGVFTVLGICLVPTFMQMLRMPDDVRPEAVTYLTIWFGGISSLMIYNMGAGIMRAVGDSRRPFYFLVVSALTNTVLDLLFVLVFRMGVAGVALATVVAQTVSAVLVVCTLLKTDSSVKLSPKHIGIDFPTLLSIIKIGLPAAFQLSITSFSNIFVQSYVNFFGKECMGGWTAYGKIDQMVLLPMQSLSIAATTFVGQNLGVGNVKRAEKGANRAFLLSLCSTLMLVVPITLFSEFFVSIFNSNPLIIEYGALFLRLLTPFYLVWCVNQIYAGALRGAGRSTVLMIIMLSCFVGFRQVYLFIVTNFIANNVVLVAIAFPAGWTLASICTLIYYKVKGLKKNALGSVEKSEAQA